MDGWGAVVSRVPETTLGQRKGGREGGGRPQKPAPLRIAAGRNVCKIALSENTRHCDTIHKL